MKWLVAVLALLALFVSIYVLQRTRRLETATQPRVRLLAAAHTAG